jgi:enoyl-CoA hydratase/carnithine racemase
MSAQFLEVTRVDAVCVVRLRREEKLNALSVAVERELQEALTGDAVRTSACVVFTGSGRAFSAGADITEFADRAPEAIAAYYRETGAVYEQIAALPQPTVAAIHGYCLGGGLELALAADLRIADATALFAFPEVALGILPSSGGLYRATRLLGPGRAKQLLLLGERISAADALALGLVTETVPAGEAHARALEVAARLATMPPLALSVTKQAIDAVASTPRDAALLIERLAYGMLAQTEAAKNAADAFDKP